MALSECSTKIDRQGRELLEHGTALFPVACYYDNLAVEEVPWHWHEEMEAVVVTAGKTAIAAGARKYTLSEGDAFFINGSVLHAMWDMENSGARYHSVVFHPRLVGSMDSIFWQDYVRPLMENPTLECVIFGSILPWHREAADAVESAWQNCATEPAGYEFRVREALSRLVFLLTAHADNPPSRPDAPTEKTLRDSERIKTMLRYIQDNYADELTTARIAQSAAVSESECLRCFKSTIGIPPIQYLKQLRIREAAKLLATTPQKISDISTQCGFPDTSYFTKTFRQAKGITPTQYRHQF